MVAPYYTGFSRGREQLYREDCLGIRQLRLTTFFSKNL